MGLHLSGSTTAQLNSAYVQTRYSDIAPEKYGAGYGGAASDDWGPAINQAIVDATAAGANVALLGASYGIRTTIVWPSGSQVGLVGRGQKTTLLKLADVTLINQSGTSGVREYARNLYRIYLHGGDTVGWTAPLHRNDYTSQCRYYDCTWYKNYGAAVTSKQAWDHIYTNPAFQYVGGTDGATPAVNLNGTIADGANATNNVWFVNPRFEDFRSGALWAVGGDTTSMLFGIKIIGNAKIEVSAGNAYYGPYVRLGYVQGFQADATQLTMNGGAVAGTQSRPFPAFLHAYGSRGVQLGRIYSNIGSVAAGDVSALFHFDGATASNTLISWQDMALTSGSGTTSNKPASVFLWSGTNSFVSRGPVRWSSNFWNVPTDSGSPTSISSLPTVSGVSDATYAAAANRTAVDGDMVWDTATAAAAVRISGSWTPFASGAASADVQTFTSNGTWTKPAGAKTVRVIAIGPGAGGGSGARVASGTIGGGGAGGGSGPFNVMDFPASTLTSTVSISIGPGGTGGAAQTVDSTAGNAGGTPATATAFGGYMSAFRSFGGGGGGIAAAASGGGPGAGLGSGATGASTAATGLVPSAGANAANTGSGGGGGGITAGGVASAGSAGGTSTLSVTTAGTAGTTGGGAGGAGTTPTSGEGGSGGGGGGANASGAGGAGGNGGGYGSGGGGGGASLNGSASGKGGDGTAGLCIVITYF